MGFEYKSTEIIGKDVADVRSELAQNVSFITGKKGYPLIAPHPHVNNPVLTKESVTDRTGVEGVADPFICYEDGMYHMFFEVITDAPAEEIGHAYSYDGLSWTYTQIVLTEAGQHFAYPLVMKHNGKWYMIPDKGNQTDIYEATNFPSEWVLLKNILPDTSTDSTVFEYKGTWYMHTRQNLVVNLYYTDDLINGTWALHPSSPILDKATDRGAGRAFVYDDCVILPMQGVINAYGDFAQFYKLTNLSKTTVTVTQGNMFINGQLNGQWNNDGMHHMDHVEGIDNTIMVVDGIYRATANNWGIGIYTESEKRNIRGKVWGPSAQSITNNTWTVLNIGGAGNVAYDTLYLWDRNNNHFTIPQDGYYRVKMHVADYATTAQRNSIGKIYDKTNAKTIVEDSRNIPSGGSQLHNNTIACETVVFLKKGVQIDAQFKSTVDVSLSAGEYKFFFEIEKVD